MLGRIVIDDVRPRTPAGYPAKAVVGEVVELSADVFKDGHDVIAARVRWRPCDKDLDSGEQWAEARLHPVGNDRWIGHIEPTTLGLHELIVDAWLDAYATWRHKITTKLGAGQEVDIELEEGARLLQRRASQVADEQRLSLDTAAALLRDADQHPWERMRAALEPDVADLLSGPLDDDHVTTSDAYPLWVDRERALVGAWYELFPRSEGGLRGAIDRLPAVAEMGFDVLYVPPIHPIGHTFRKGKNNTLDPEPGDVGSPWAIGSEEGGHTAVHPDLGTIEDWDAFVAAANDLGIEIALDYALQCSPDHPWVTEHPEWFHQRPDGSIAYAENPPKKYQDIYPINFWPARDADRIALWEACRDILEHWVEHGVRIFRVDNPHTKPMAFWEWVLAHFRDAHPDVIFLSEAFTRPKVMAKLAEVGFHQSYTYFTWRNARWEFEQYLAELTAQPLADYFRPNFWTNTQDILSGPLRNGAPHAFKMRLVLAATLAPSYGMYSGFELCENQPLSDLNEEYLDSEKYEIKRRDWSDPKSLAPYVGRINDIRRRHPALQRLRNIRFHGSNNEQVMAYSKVSGDDVVLVVVNLDPHNAHAATLDLDLGALGLPGDEPFEASDELTGQRFTWDGRNPYVWLDPWHEPAHILSLRALT